MKVSIRLMTYNHEAYIEEALKGINNQRTNFEFEAVVGDDFSTDNTLQKIKNYRITNSNLKLRILERTKGDDYDKKRQEKGRLYNFVNILEHCKGTYIALLDGDDYWTDPLKLQKQVDFLEAHPGYAICFHRANVQREDGSMYLHSVPESKTPYYTYTDLLQQYNFITTASVVFRKPDAFILPAWFFKIPFGDMGLYYLLSKNRKIACIEDCMSVYRIHTQGVFQKNNKLHQNKQFLQFFSILYPHLDEKNHKKIVHTKIKSLIQSCVKLAYPNNLIMQKFYKWYITNKYSL